MKFEVLIFGEQALATKFTRMGDDALDASPAFDNVAEYLFKITDTTFNSQGRRGGGSWRMLTPKWAKYKAKRGWDTRILHQFGNLRESVTRRGAKGQILDIRPQSLLFGSDLEYAARHQFGVPGKTPKREFVKVTKNDTMKIRDLIRDHLMRAWRARK